MKKRKNRWRTKRIRRKRPKSKRNRNLFIRGFAHRFAHIQLRSLVSILVTMTNIWLQQLKVNRFVDDSIEIRRIFQFRRQRFALANERIRRQRSQVKLEWNLTNLMMFSLLQDTLVWTSNSAERITSLLVPMESKENRFDLSFFDRWFQSVSRQFSQR